jgi:hypothetical protein
MNIGGGDRVWVWFAEPVEARAELLVVDRHLAVEHEGPRRQLGDRRRDRWAGSRRGDRPVRLDGRLIRGLSIISPSARRSSPMSSTSSTTAS